MYFTHTIFQELDKCVSMYTSSNNTGIEISNQQILILKILLERCSKCHLYHRIKATLLKLIWNSRINHMEENIVINQNMTGKPMVKLWMITSFDNALKASGMQTLAQVGIINIILRTQGKKNQIKKTLEKIILNKGGFGPLKNTIMGEDLLEGNIFILSK